MTQSTEIREKIHFNCWRLDGDLLSEALPLLHAKMRQHKLVMRWGNSVSDFDKKDGERCVKVYNLNVKVEKYSRIAGYPGYPGSWIWKSSS